MKKITSRDSLVIIFQKKKKKNDGSNLGRCAHSAFLHYILTIDLLESKVTYIATSSLKESRPFAIYLS